MQRPGVWVCVALLVGLGAGFLLGRGSEPDAGSQPLPELDAPREPSDAKPPPELRTAEAPAPEAAAAGSGIVTEGQGVIRGTVRGPAGEPMEGVVVEAQPLCRRRAHHRGVVPG